MNPNEFTGGHTSYVKRNQGTAIHEYEKFTNARKTPVVALKCGLVVPHQMPVLPAPLMGKLLTLGAVNLSESWKLSIHQQNLLLPQWMLVRIPHFSVNEVINVVCVV